MKTVQELLDFFKEIPEDLWCTYYFERPSPEGVIQRCALGHLNHHMGGNAIPYHDDGFVHGVCEPSVLAMGLDPKDFIRANNNELGEFPGDTPKKRVIKFLESKKQAA